MQRSRFDAKQIEADERLRSELRDNRNRGLKGVKQRDQGVQTLSNGVTMLWPVPPLWSDTVDGWSTRLDDNVQEGFFVLVIDGKRHTFDTEEFRRWLRWA